MASADCFAAFKDVPAVEQVLQGNLNPMSPGTLRGQVGIWLVQGPSYMSAAASQRIVFRAEPGGEARM
jgi:hypothetical protein